MMLSTLGIPKTGPLAVSPRLVRSHLPEEIALMFWVITKGNSGEQEPARKKQKVADPSDEPSEESDTEEEDFSQGAYTDTN